jgi:hypothetical protein
MFEVPPAERDEGRCTDFRHVRNVRHRLRKWRVSGGLTRCRYKDKASIEVHGNTDYFKNLGKAFKEEDLLGEPMKVMFTKEAGGYASRL